MKIERQNWYEDFEVGQLFRHRLGRTIGEFDNSLFTTLTLAYHPLFLDEHYAKSQGFASRLINPLLLLNVAIGLSVEDLSETNEGGAFLGIENLLFHRQSSPGVTIYAESEVVSARVAASRPQFGIVTWHTVATDHSDEQLFEFDRTNLVPRRHRT